MLRSRALLAGLVLFLTCGVTAAADLPLAAASGRVFKATAHVLIIQPRNSEGRLGDKLILKLRGTSKVSALTTQTRKGQVVVVQNDTEAASLRPNERIAVIYTQVKNEYVLLEAVIESGSGK